MHKNSRVINARIADLKHDSFIGTVQAAVVGRPIHLGARKN